ncbi:MAG: DegT/DnrJ/EryC1/StrS family aminotransferase [Patescibacteria group bacterium]
MINEYPYNQPPKHSTRSGMETIESYLSRFYQRPALVLASARAGYYQALKFFGLTRRDHVLVPDFLCQAILNITNVSGFPVKQVDEKTKAVLVFHQWGYPQKMDEVLAEASRRNLIVIEDCAHSFGSKYKGRLVGTFGQAAFFSFAKLFPTYLGGVLVSDNAQFIEFAKKERAQKDNFSNRLFNFVAGRIAEKSFDQAKARFWLDIVYLKSIHYPNLSSKYLGYLPANQAEFEGDQRARKQNYLTLKNSIKKEYLIAEREEEIDPIPFLMPVFLPEEKLAPAREALSGKNIFADILHFDINRNVFASNYKKCLAAPCHQGLGNTEINNIVDVVNRI